MVKIMFTMGEVISKIFSRRCFNGYQTSRRATWRMWSGRPGSAWVWEDVGVDEHEIDDDNGDNDEYDVGDAGDGDGDGDEEAWCSSPEAKALGHAGVQHAEFLAEAGKYASAHQKEFGTQEMPLGELGAAHFFSQLRVGRQKKGA